MDLASSLLHNLVHLYALCSSSDAVVPISLKSMLFQTFSGISATTLLERCADALLPSDVLVSPHLRDPLDELTEQVAAALARDSTLEPQFARTYAATELLLGMLAARGAPKLGEYVATVTQPDTFSYIRNWSPLEGTSNKPIRMVAVSRLSSAMKINFGEGNLSLAKVAIRYPPVGAEPWPLLTVQREARSPRDGVQVSRQDWVQRPVAGDTITFIRGGSIATVIEPTPCSLRFGGGTLLIDEKSGVAVLSTRVNDKDGSTLAHCLRVVRQLPDHPERCESI